MEALSTRQLNCSPDGCANVVVAFWANFIIRSNQQAPVAQEPFHLDGAQEPPEKGVSARQKGGGKDSFKGECATVPSNWCISARSPCGKKATTFLPIPDCASTYNM